MTPDALSPTPGGGGTAAAGSSAARKVPPAPRATYGGGRGSKVVAPGGTVTPVATSDHLRFELAPEPPFHAPSVRGPVVFLAILVLVSAVIFPGAVTLVADVVSPVTPQSLSTLLGENVSNPALFWPRPSQIDWQAFSGAGGETPYGPVDPALRNATLQYIQEYGLGNVTVPLDLVSPSFSGLDPDLYPDAALVQLPRVAHFSNVSVPVLWGLVNASTTTPAYGLAGPTYVNVITLDELLLQQPQMAGAWI